MTEPELVKGNHADFHQRGRTSKREGSSRFGKRLLSKVGSIVSSVLKGLRVPVGSNPSSGVETRDLLVREGVVAEILQLILLFQGDLVNDNTDPKRDLLVGGSELT
jgi:hypothetical protein